MKDILKNAVDYIVSRLSETSTKAGIAGAVASAVGVPAGYLEPTEAIVGAVLSALAILIKEKWGDKPEGE